MTIQTIDYLKSRFLNVEKPDQQDFADLFESFAHLTDTLTAYSILKRDTTATAASALTVPVSTFVGRKASGNITAISISEAQTMLGVSVPTGAVLPYAASAAPDGWLICNGAEVSRTDYANLFGLIGIAYGNGDASTTFNLPDLRGRAPVGLDSDHSLGNAFGAATASASHSHNVTPNSIPIHEGEGTLTNVASPTPAPTDSATVTIDTIPPSIALNYIIKI